MERLRDSLDGVPIVQFGEYRYFVHPITDGIPRIDPSLLRDVSMEIIRKVDFDTVDVILAPEAMGIHLATAVSLQVDVPVSIARKRSYDLDGEVSVAQVTGYDENDLYINGIEEGDWVVVIDDVLSTGGTMRAIHEAIETIGAELIRFVVIFEKADGTGREQLRGIPADSLLRVAVVDDRVEIYDA